jgi:Uma2 family endonuclease
MAATQTERVSEATYRRLALADPIGQLELVRGQLWEKPGMSVVHRVVIMRLLELLLGQLDRHEHRLSTTHARLRRSADTYYVPDIAVIPAALEQALLAHPDSLDAYPEPLPLVVEVWSPSTGRYDITEKLPDYQARGDLEIWFIHPYERTVTAWRQQQDGSYAVATYREGTIRPESLPAVAVELELIFAP